MTAAHTDNKATHRVPKHRWAWRLGRAVGARRWPTRLAVGVMAWIALGAVTAALAPGTVEAGAIGAWLSAGVGLVATTLIAHGCHRRHGILAALVAAVAMLGVTAAVVVLVDWSAVVNIVTLVAILGAAFGLVVYVLPFFIGDDRVDRLFRSGMRRSGDDHHGDDYYNEDGYRNGPQGWGWYVNDMKYGDDGVKTD